MEAHSCLHDFRAIIDQKRALVEALRQAKYGDVIAPLEHVRLIEGRARLLSPTTVEVNGEHVSADRMVIATGASPNIPKVPSLADSNYLTT